MPTTPMTWRGLESNQDENEVALGFSLTEYVLTEAAEALASARSPPSSRCRADVQSSAWASAVSWSLPATASVSSHSGEFPVQDSVPGTPLHR